MERGAPLILRIDTRKPSLEFTIARCLWRNHIWKAHGVRLHWMRRRVQMEGGGRGLLWNSPRLLYSCPLSQGPALVQGGLMPDALQGRRGPLLDLPSELFGIPMRLLLRSSSWLQMDSPLHSPRIEHPHDFLELPRGESSTIEKRKERRERGRCESCSRALFEFWCTWLVRERKYATVHSCTIHYWHAGSTSWLVEQATGLREIKQVSSEWVRLMIWSAIPITAVVLKLDFMEQNLSVVPKLSRCVLSSCLICLCIYRGMWNSSYYRGYVQLTS